MGDMTELNSLMALWGSSGWKRRQCAIGSVKSMIGHLLTAAGAAGMIKTVLALGHRTLPPQIHFNRPPADSPLTDGPFRVQTEPDDWPRRDPSTPRRAAVSAFGFGGINGHLLLEEWDDAGRAKDPEPDPAETGQPIAAASPDSGGAIRVRDRQPEPAAPVAIVGMDAAFGTLKNLRAFQETIFNGRSILADPPPRRWKGCETLAQPLFGNGKPRGGFIPALSVTVGAHHMPPREMPDILPQQLLMLQVAARAMADAGLGSRKKRPAMGAVIGIDFDFEATDFHLRWSLGNHLRRWSERLGVAWDPEMAADWLAALQDSCGPPLTAVRTLGALGSIVASRLAREFLLGGPSFVVSAEAAAGLSALEIAVRSLQQNETEAMLVGAVDMAGDIRKLLATAAVTPFSTDGRPAPFDRSAGGIGVGEGATALVLKRLDRAETDGDRIYAVVRGIGGAAGGGIDTPVPSAAAYRRSLERSFTDAGVLPRSIGFVETHGSGLPAADDMEAEALCGFFGIGRRPRPRR